MIADDVLARLEALRLPRYTSYPTAPHFKADVDAATQARWLEAIDGKQTLSLYLHVPFCAVLCHYCGCHTVAVRRPEPVAAYAGLLAREIDLVAGVMTARPPVTHIHWGGGTPTLLAPADFERLTSVLRQRFAVAPDAEVAVEIDPRTLGEGELAALARGGVNRASLGVQSFDTRVQAAIGRVQSFETTRDAAERLRAAGIAAISFDLMYGLPHQSAASVGESIGEALTLAPDRVSLFGYAHVPWMKKHQALIPEDSLPNGPERFAQIRAATTELARAGYVRVGLDHFARPDDPLARSLAAGTLRRNFQGYTTDAAPALIGIGASAISGLPQGYAQNAAPVPAYRAAIEAGRLATVRGIALSPEDRLRRAIIERLMCDLAVDVGALRAAHGVSMPRFAREFAAVDALAHDGLAERRGESIVIPEAARDVARVVAAAFDAYLSPGGPARHARAV